MTDSDGANMTGEEGGPKSADHYYALPAGTRIHEFEIVRTLGHGGFGITYLALDTHLQQEVAIKEFLPSEIAVRAPDASVRPKSEGIAADFSQGLSTFLTEARTMARFRSPRIVHVRRFFEAHGTGYIVLDYERGDTLSARLAKGALAPGSLATVMGGLLEGLSALHDSGVLHRDLKPGNVMLRGDDPVIIDFGAARDFIVRSSRSVTAIASPGYSPPEQYGAGGQQGPWTDLYALGAICYKAVTGQAPPDSLRRLRRDPVVPAAQAAAGRYDPVTLSVIDWMMRVDEEDRPGSVAAVREALAGGPIPGGAKAAAPAPEAAPAAAPPPARKSRRPLAIAACLALLAAGGGTFALIGHRGSQERPQRESAAAEDAAKSARETAEASARDAAEAKRRAARAREMMARADGSVYAEASLNAVLRDCGEDCDASVRERIAQRLAKMASERSAYEAARGNAALLARYMAECAACEFTSQAFREKSDLESRAGPSFHERLRILPNEQAALSRFLAECSASPSCAPETMAEARMRSDALQRQASYAAEEKRRADEGRAQEAAARHARDIADAGTSERPLVKAVTACLEDGPLCPAEALAAGLGRIASLPHDARWGAEEGEFADFFAACSRAPSCPTGALERARSRMEATQREALADKVARYRWSHNGSTMEVVEAKGRFEIRYASPKELLRRNGVAPGTVLFSGIRDRTEVRGTAYVFKKGCPPAGFEATGGIATDGAYMEITGTEVPQRNAACNVVKTEGEALSFMRID